MLLGRVELDDGEGYGRETVRLTMNLLRLRGNYMC